MVAKKGTTAKARANVFTKNYATSVLVEETDADTRLYLFNEVIDTTDGERIAICDGNVILTTEAAILLTEQLNEIVEKWKKKGPLTVSKERRALLNEIR